VRFAGAEGFFAEEARSGRHALILEGARDTA
jgi:hypothetical protein